LRAARAESEMNFRGDPTAAGDNFAEYLRSWYEANRETWWDRSAFNKYGWKRGLADNFMLAMLDEVRRIQAEYDRQREPTN
jgi:hypothetical protein